VEFCLEPSYNYYILYRSAGWGLAVFSLSPSSKALLLAELFGPVVTNSKSGYFLGANAQTNNTAELSAIGEALLWLILNWKKFYNLKLKII
jgi:ribonuclease HI